MTSTIQESQGLNSLTSNKSARSSYQTTGKPLSKEAEYKARLRQGVFKQPGARTVGVDSSASDAAALLAASSDLSIHPYKRDLSSEAATAALIANPKISIEWHRGEHSGDAELAALSAKPESVTSKRSANHLSSDAAASVLRAPSIAKRNLDHIYEPSAIGVKGTYTPAEFDALRKAAERNAERFVHDRHNPVLDQQRSGLSTATQKQLKQTDYRNLEALARGSATSNVHIRSNPAELDHRSGLKTSLQYQDVAVDLSKINAAATESARKSISRRMSASQTGVSQLASHGATASLSSKSIMPDLAAQERSSLAKNTLVDKSVLAKAILNADQTLAKLETDAHTKGLFTSREWNIKAIEIAQANMAKRQTNAGKIDLGGGLFMSMDELNRMAEGVVRPVLTDIDTKAGAQRDADTAHEKRQLDLKSKQRAAREEKKRLKQEDKARKEEEKEARRQEHEAEKDAELAKQTEFQNRKKDELQEKQNELDTQTAQEEESKVELLREKQEKEDVIAENEESSRVAHAKELEDLQKEKDDEAAPIVEQLDAETNVLNGLVTKRETAAAFASEQSQRAAFAQDKLDVLTRELQEVDELLAKATEEAATAEAEVEKSNPETDAFVAEKQQEKKDLEAKEAEMIAERDRLETSKVELQKEKEDKLAELEIAKKEAHEEEVAINEALPSHLKKEVLPYQAEPVETVNPVEKVETEQLKPEEVQDADVPATQKPLTTPKQGDEKPAMVEVVNSAEVRAASAPKSATTPKREPVKTSVPAKGSSPKKSGLRTKLKNMFNTAPPTPAQPKSKPFQNQKQTVAPVKKDEPVKETEGGELKQTFSGFSQGSEKEAVPA